MPGKPFELVKEIKKCPACDSNLGFMKKLAKKLKKKGWMDEEFHFWMFVREGIVHQASPIVDAKIPIGSGLPAHKVCIEVCSECGCVYAGRIYEAEAVKGVKMPKPTGPEDLMSKLPFIGKG